MPAVHNIGRLYTHKFAYPDRVFPVVDRGLSQETTWPFRSSRPWVVRIPFSRYGFVLGWWGQEVPEDVAMERAVSGALIGYEPTREYGDRDGEEAPEEDQEDRVPEREAVEDRREALQASWDRRLEERAAGRDHEDQSNGPDW